MAADARRILILTDVLGGGTGNHVFALLRHWDSSKYRASILSQAPRYDGLACPDAETLVLPRRLRGAPYPLGQLETLVRIERRVAAAPPDLVHAYFFWSILYARLLKRFGRIRRLVENREDVGFAWGWHETAWLRATRGLPDRVICVSEAVRRAALEREGLDPARAVVIHNGVDPAGAAPAGRAAVRRELGLGADDLVVGMIANWNRPVKDVPAFLEAMPAIARAVPAARFLLVGEGTDDPALRARARALGVETRLVLAGFRAHAAPVYAGMDVSVLTSRTEGLSITLLESMNHGLPVVVTRVGGNPEVVVEGATGHLVPPGDVPAFTERVVGLLRDPALRARMGAAARARVATHFRLSEVSSRYLSVYGDVVSGR